MKRAAEPLTVLIADEDETERRQTRKALEQSCVIEHLRFVHNGEELMHYLRREGRWQLPVEAPRPGLILLDLNLPRKDGRTVLREMKNDPQLKDIPVVALTASAEDADVYRSYHLEVSSYLLKPVSHDSLVRVLETLNR